MNAPLASRLAGRSAVVTGASRGIGRAIARGLAAAGARAILVARDTPTLEKLAAEIGGGASAITCDLSRRDDTLRAVDTILHQLGGAPDVLVSAAGQFYLAELEHTAPEEFGRTIDVNLVAPFLFAHAFVPGMRARRTGHVVTIGSIADRTAYTENTAYAASKFGLRAMHEVLRAETRGSGVRVSLVSPGPVDTPLWDPVNPDTRPGFTRRDAMLSAESVADAVIYALCAPPELNVDELRLSRA